MYPDDRQCLIARSAAQKKKINKTLLERALDSPKTTFALFQRAKESRAKESSHGVFGSLLLKESSCGMPVFWMMESHCGKQTCNGGLE